MIRVMIAKLGSCSDRSSRCSVRIGLCVLDLQVLAMWFCEATEGGGSTELIADGPAWLASNMLSNSFFYQNSEDLNQFERWPFCSSTYVRGHACENAIGLYCSQMLLINSNVNILLHVLFFSIYNFKRMLSRARIWRIIRTARSSVDVIIASRIQSI
jgi:hypothetical protein